MASDTDLIYEDGLPKFFHKSDNFLGIPCLIEDPGNLPLFQQCLRSCFNVFQRPIAGDQVRMDDSFKHDTNFVSCERLSTSSGSSSGFTFAKVTSNFSNHGTRSLSLSFTSLYSWLVIVSGVEDHFTSTYIVVFDQCVNPSQTRFERGKRVGGFFRDVEYSLDDIYESLLLSCEPSAGL